MADEDAVEGTPDEGSPTEPLPADEGAVEEVPAEATIEESPAEGEAEAPAPKSKIDKGTQRKSRFKDKLGAGAAKAAPPRKGGDPLLSVIAVLVGIAATMAGAILGASQIAERVVDPAMLGGGFALVFVGVGGMTAALSKFSSL